MPLFILLSISLATALTLTNIDKDIKLTEEKQTALNSLGLSQWTIKDYEIGTEQVERCLIKENKLSACQQFKTFYTNCSSYNETSNECLVMNKLYYTESEMTNILNEWENERINLIANTKISRDNKVKQEIRTGETIIKDINEL